MSRLFLLIFLCFNIDLSFASIDSLPTCRTFKDYPIEEKNRLQGLMTSYRELYKAQKYMDALPQWKEIYTLAPANNGKTKGFYDDGVNIYVAVMKTAPAAEHSRYADTIKILHAKREECFGIDGKYTGQKAFDYYFHIKPFVSEEETYAMFKKAFEMNNNRMDYFTVNPFMALLKSRLVSGKVKAEEAGRFAHMAYNSMIEGVKTCTGNICESWKKVEEYSGKTLLELETMPGVMPSAYYLDKNHQQFIKSPTDCIIAKQALANMNKAKCDANDAKYIEVKTFVETCK
jgi:hypothetical protein